jgi:hypothetical protein
MEKKSQVLAQQELLSRQHERKHLKPVIAKRRRMMFRRKSARVSCKIEHPDLRL